MRPTTYARTLHDLNVLTDLGFSEVILEPKGLSRFGKLSVSDFRVLSSRARELDLKVILEWDALMTEDVFEKSLPLLRELLPSTDSLRVQDPGALEWALSETNLPIQFIAENGNHNQKALEGWIAAAQGRLERLILSIELSKVTLAVYLKELNVPCELLGFGRILLFYTPRNLLSPLLDSKVPYNQELLSLGESEESPHKGFPLVENQNGTFMFHIKEFCLLDFAQELKTMGLSFFRIDQRWSEKSFLPEIVELLKSFDPLKFESLKASYPEDLMRGFYLVNKTDVLFPKLKNSRLQKREGAFVGEVLDAEKGSHLALLVRNPEGLSIEDEIRVLHPKGEVFDSKVYTLKNIAQEDVKQVPQGEIALIQFIGGVWVKSQVFLR